MKTNPGSVDSLTAAEREAEIMLRESVTEKTPEILALFTHHLNARPLLNTVPPVRMFEELTDGQANALTVEDVR